uniref:Uncharacterized protein n=1 Tax=Nothobranchius korthausae TaxID=1143690 RepID=A0A1A8ELQ5_9TELE
MTQSTLNQKDRVWLISRSEGVGLFWNFFFYIGCEVSPVSLEMLLHHQPFTPYTFRHIRNKKSFNFITGIPSGSQTHRSFLQKQEHLVLGWTDSESSSSAALLVLLNTKSAFVGFLF